MPIPLQLDKTTIKTCPLCRKLNISSKLKLHQINFKSAVYLCERKHCRYPEGCGWEFVPRTLHQLSLQMRRERKEKESEIEKNCFEEIEAEVEKLKDGAADSVDFVNADEVLMEIFDDVAEWDSGISQEQAFDVDTMFFEADGATNSICQDEGAANLEMINEGDQNEMLCCGGEEIDSNYQDKTFCDLQVVNSQSKQLIPDADRLVEENNLTDELGNDLSVPLCDVINEPIAVDAGLHKIDDVKTANVLVKNSVPIMCNNVKTNCDIVNYKKTVISDSLVIKNLPLQYKKIRILDLRKTANKLHNIASMKIIKLSNK